MRKIFGFVAAAAMLSSTTAAVAADQKKCMPAAEAEALIIFILPGTLTAISKKCAKTLNTDDALLQLNSQRMANYETESKNAQPLAQQAVKYYFGDFLPEEADSSKLLPFAETITASVIAEDVKTKDCDKINRVYELLEPMPVKNLASLVSLVLSSESSQRDSRAPDICKPSAE